MPRVSICIPAYKPQHFEQCLASALGQTYTDTEILVSDDCPDDSIKQICDRYPGAVIYSRNPNPDGKGSRNVLNVLANASGEYIKFLFDDDLLHPDCIAGLLSCFTAAPDKNVTLAFSPRDVIDESGELIEHLNLLGAKDRISLLGGLQLIGLMATCLQNPIGEFTTVMFRKKDAVDAQGRPTIYEVDGQLFKGLTDVATWINLAEKGAVAVHPQTLSYFRKHRNSNSSPTMNPEFIYAITDWELVINHAVKRKLLSALDALIAYKALFLMYRTWAPAYPQLAEEVQRIMNSADFQITMRSVSAQQLRLAT